jgi:hypothetical protein
MAVDLNRIATAALESFLNDEERPAREPENGAPHLGGIGAVALGVGLAVAARAAYKRARRVDLARVAGSVEKKLSR